MLLNLMAIELFIVGALRAVVEVALLALLGQGLVGFLAGASRRKNPIYALFSIIVRPPVRLMRCIAPQAIIDRHLPYLTFFVLFWLWILLAYGKRSLCASGGLGGSVC